jgi:hypothetical protein
MGAPRAAALRSSSMKKKKQKKKAAAPINTRFHDLPVVLRIPSKVVGVWTQAAVLF